MIKDEKYKDVLESGLLLDHYFLLCQIYNGVKPVENKRIQGFINLLTKKEYLREDALTQKGIDLIEDCMMEPVNSPSVTRTTTKNEYLLWVTNLHEKCQNLLVKKTGKKQVSAKINGGKPYPFLPNLMDLAKTLQKVILKYKLSDYDLIEKTILRNIEKCAETNNWFPILGYYIFKNESSTLVTDMSTDDSETATESSIDRVDPNSLF